MAEVDPLLPRRLSDNAAVRRGEARVYAAAVRSLDVLAREIRSDLAASHYVPVSTRVWPAWEAAVEEQVGKAIRDVYASAYDDPQSLVAAASLDARENAVRFMRAVYGRLVRVADEVWSAVHAVLTEGVEKHEAIPNIARKVDDALAEQGAERWRGRATTIARTETIAAFNHGRLDGGRALAAAVGVPERDVFKSWLSTRTDDRTRSTHRAADRQTVPLAARFVVGGARGLAPGDPLLPADEVCNCRCTVLVLLPGDRGYPENHTPSVPLTLAAAATYADPEPQEEPVSEPTIEQADLDEIADGVPVPWHGVLAPEGVMSGDRRKFAAGSLTHRDLPLPLLYQTATAEGHDGAVRVANITNIERADGVIRAWGVFASHENADAAIAEIAEQMLRGVSVDVDSAEFAFEDEDGSPITGDVHEFDGDPVMVVGAGRVSGATLCSIPAFQQAFVALGEPPEEWGQGESLVAAGGEPDEESGTPTWAVGDFVRWERVTDSDIEETVMAYGRVVEVEIADDITVQPLTAGGEEMGEPVVLSPDQLQQWSGPRGVTVKESKAQASGIEVTTFDGVPGVMPRKLKEYWTHGEGAARIKWNSAGDFDRCRRALASEGVPARMVSGACANLHHAATGAWPGREKASGEVVTAGGRALVAAAPPATTGRLSDYADPHLVEPTPITIEDDGRVFGHLATWSTCHVGFADQCITPPTSASAYAYFTTGEVRVEGVSVPVGQITMGTGHAGARLGPKPTVDHYDHTGTAIADVAAGEDVHGIWIAGRLRASATPEQVTALRAAALSGDWRRIGGSMELVAALAVNVPGFPIPRTASAMSQGRQSALVASGVVAPSRLIVVGQTEQPAPVAPQSTISAAEIVSRTRRLDALAASIGQDKASRVAAARKIIERGA